MPLRLGVLQSKPLLSTRPVNSSVQVRCSYLSSGRKPIRSLWAIASLLASLLVFGGCSVKFAYNNADRLVRWSVSDYVDLSKAQRTYFDAELANFLYWHRATQLPLYAGGIQDLNNAIKTGISVAQAQSSYREFERWALAAQDRMLPLATQVLLSMTPEQRQEFPGRFAKANQEWVEEEWGKSREEAQAQWLQGFADGFKRFIGRLTKEQLTYLAQRVTAYEPEAELWLAYRQRWQEQLLQLLNNQLDAEQFQRDFVALAKNREQYYGDYAAVYAANQALAEDIVLWLLTNLSSGQLTKLDKRMTALQRDFHELAQDLPAAVPARPPCLTYVSGCPVAQSN